MSSAALPELIRDAAWLAQAYDPPSRQIRFVHLTEEDYRSASFLDDRMFQSHRHVQVAPADAVVAAASPDARRDAHWIFHIGHVGSTLIARLLGELPGLLSVREPRLLRDLAGLPPEQRPSLADAAQALLSRTFRPDQRALVKATSFVSEVAAELVGSEGRTLLVTAEPATYIASILAGENSRKELHALAESRAQRGATRVGPLARAQSSDAHLAAAAWACEMTSLVQASETITGELMWVDFDRLLADLPAQLARLAGFFGVTAEQPIFDRIAAGPLIRRYSKDMAYEYSPGLRHELIRDASMRHREEIADALRMLHQASAQSPLLDKALQQSRMET